MSDSIGDRYFEFRIGTVPSHHLVSQANMTGLSALHHRIANHEKKLGKEEIGKKREELAYTYHDLADAQMGNAPKKQTGTYTQQLKYVPLDERKN